MRDVYVVTDGAVVYGYFVDKEIADMAAELTSSPSVTVTRETLLTPAMAAVIAAAVSMQIATDTHSKAVEEISNGPREEFEQRLEVVDALYETWQSSIEAFNKAVNALHATTPTEATP